MLSWQMKHPQDTHKPNELLVITSEKIITDLITIKLQALISFYVERDSISHLASIQTHVKRCISRQHLLPRYPINIHTSCFI